MKLLAKSTLYLIIFSLAIFVAGGFIFYFNLRTQIYQEVDQSLVLEKERIIQKLMVSDSVPSFYTNFENQITVETKEKDMLPYVKISDTLIYDSIEKGFQPFRKLQSRIFLYTKAYQIDISKSMINKGELISDVFLLMLFLFLALLTIMLAVNFFISKKLLHPFYQTLEILKKYRVTKSPKLSLSKTRTKEFTLLNQVLNIMSEKIHSDFLSLKEFTENTSHEMQTPLAIIKAKLELLIQDESLSGDQLKLIQSIGDSASRLSKMSRALVLITRIENMQFRETGEVDLIRLVDDLLDNFSEMIAEKKIQLNRNYVCGLSVKMNPSLAEILVTNLIGNAIKHNLPEGRIDIHTAPCELVISNTGPPLISRPDELFRRFSKDRSRPDSLGLGLAIVQKIADTNNINVDYSCKENVHTLRVLFGKSLQKDAD